MATRDANGAGCGWLVAGMIIGAVIGGVPGWDRYKEGTGRMSTTNHATGGIGQRLLTSSQ